jgi:hypothetical protein
MDEIGYQMSHLQKESVVFDRRTGPPLLIVSGSTGWASVLETINARLKKCFKSLRFHNTDRLHQIYSLHRLKFISLRKNPTFIAK